MVKVFSLLVHSFKHTVCRYISHSFVQHYCHFLFVLAVLIHEPIEKSATVSVSCLNVNHGAIFQWANMITAVSIHVCLIMNHREKQ